MFYYLGTAYFLLAQTIKYSYQCTNLLKTQNDSNTPANLATLLKVKNKYIYIYILTWKYTYMVISMIGRFSTVYTSSVHVMIGKKSIQQSTIKTKWFEVPCPHDLLPHSYPPYFELYFRSFFLFLFSMLPSHISIDSIYCLTHNPVTRY